MLDYFISSDSIKKGQVAMLIFFSILTMVNLIFLFSTRTINVLILTTLTLLLFLMFSFLSSKLYQVHFFDNDIYISNLFRIKKFTKFTFDSVSTFVSFAGIYRINLKNGESFLFIVDKDIQIKNLFNIDPDKYAQELTKDIIDRINLYHK